MAGKLYELEFKLTDGTSKKVKFEAPEGPQGPAYVLTEADKEEIAGMVPSGGNIEDGSITPEKTSFIDCEGSEETETNLVPNFTNLANPKSSDWKTDTRFSSSSGSMSSMTGAIVTNAIPAKVGDVIRIKGIKGGSGSTANALFQMIPYDSNGAKLTTAGVFFEKAYSSSVPNGVSNLVSVKDGVSEYTILLINDAPGTQNSYAATTASVRIGGVPVGSVDDIIVTINEPITYTEVKSGGKTYTLNEKINVPKANALKSGTIWFALGDSITEGYASAVDASASSGYKSFITEKGTRWVDIVAEKNDYILTNYGVGGTGYIQGTNNARALADTIDFSKCDIVTLAYGVNDFKYTGNNIGDMNGDITVGGTMVANMRYVIKKILADNPYCKIFVITPINYRGLGTYDTNYSIGYAGTNASGGSLENIFAKQKEVCEYYGVELIDMTHSSIVNRENIKTVLADYTHPTVKCHAVMAKELAKKINFA